MPVIDIENLNKGAWFDYGSDGSRVKIRAYTNVILQELRDKYVEKKVEYRKKAKFGDLQRIEYTEYTKDGERKMKSDLHDYIIEDWEGFVTGDKKKLPCSKKNKVALMEGSPAFAEFVDKCIETLTADNESTKESVEKN